MSYFEYYTNNIANSEAIHGSCNDMCPEDEVKKREKESMVHILEVVKSKRKLVKSYSRPAADCNVALPRLLRPYHVLKDTVRYLLLEVTKREDVPSHIVYDFVNDRLRAIRQDMTIQRLQPHQCRELLDPMVRFYVYYGYKLCEHPLKDYDPVLNKKRLLECLKWYLTSDLDYKSLQILHSQNVHPQDVHSTNVEDLQTKISNLEINDFKCDTILMHSLYILCNLDDIHPLKQYLSLPKDLRRQPRLQLAYRIAIANLHGNYIKLCRLIEQLCPLTLCAVCLYLPVVQRRAINVLSHAYTSKTLTVPVELISRWLRFGNVADAAATLEHYGVTTNGNVARFEKSQFKRDVGTKENRLPHIIKHLDFPLIEIEMFVVMHPKKLLQFYDKLDLSIDHVFTY